MIVSLHQYLKMSPFLKKSCWFLSAFLFAGGLFLGGCYLGYAMKCSFYIKNLHSPLTVQTEDSYLLPKQQMDAIFDQKFYYLGEGRQCFAFESQDKRYVVKFFKAHHMKKEEWLKEGLLASFIKNDKQMKEHQEAKSLSWEKEIDETAMRYNLALHEMPKESGLLMTHFRETTDLNKVLTVISKKKLVSMVDLDHVSFILQEKATLTKERISQYLDSNNPHLAVESIVMIQDLLIQRTQKGISDVRQSYAVNFGFGNEGALQIDVGKIVHDESLKTAPEAEIIRLSDNLKLWVKKNYPEIYPEVEKELEKNLALKTGL